MNKDFNTSLQLTGIVLFMDRIIGLISILLFIIAIYLISFDLSYFILITASIVYIIYYLLLQKISFTSPLIEIYSILSQGFQILIVYILMHSLSVKLNEEGYILLFLFSSITGMLPISIGGIGVREAIMLAGAPHLGLNSELAILIGFLFYLITLISSLPGFIIHLLSPFLKIKNYAGNY